MAIRVATRNGVSRSNAAFRDTILPNSNLPVLFCCRFGFTPLHYAATSGYIDGVDTLLRLGADVTAMAGMSGKVTAKEVRSGEERKTRVGARSEATKLCKYPADTVLTPSIQPRSSQIASQRGHLDIVDLLARWERKVDDPVNKKFKEWLSHLDCEAYAQKFIDCGYDMNFIKASGLNDEDLDCVGVPTTKLGLRKKLKDLWKIDAYLDEDEDDSDDGSDEDDSDEDSDEDSGEGSDEDDSEEYSDDDDEEDSEEDSDDE